MKKVGLLGGTFDPPHLGHLVMAEEARLKMQLDEIWWMPNRIPPHKELSMDTTEKQRLELVSHMVALHPAYKLSTIEMDRSGKSYTVDTVYNLKKHYDNIHFYFIMGGDSLQYFSTWHESERLRSMIAFIVIARPGFTIPNDEKPVKTTILDEVTLELSSSYIREKSMQGKLNRFLLTNEVYQFIKENRLYE